MSGASALQQSFSFLEMYLCKSLLGTPGGIPTPAPRNYKPDSKSKFMMFYDLLFKKKRNGQGIEPLVV